MLEEDQFMEVVEGDRFSEAVEEVLRMEEEVEGWGWGWDSLG